VAKFSMTFEGVYGGPCPACGGTGELLSHDGEFGGYRTLKHTDAGGHEHVCMLPEDEGGLRTTGGRWSYVPAVVVRAIELAAAELLAADGE